MRAELDEIKAELARRRQLAKQTKYSPSQPRVPGGNPRGGQWADRNGGASSQARGINDPRVISDADPEGIKPGEQYAQAGRRSGGAILINGRRLELSPRQAAELEGVKARADSAIARLREIEPNWKPTPSAYESVNGLIEKYRADAQQAQDRAGELAQKFIGPGSLAGESVAARGPGRDFTAAERREINRIGYDTGCHSCGTREPGTKTGNFVADHQYPSSINPGGRVQRLYPQCTTCSARQGPYVSSLKGKSR
jgi:hypothetical protein